MLKVSRVKYFTLPARLFFLYNILYEKTFFCHGELRRPKLADIQKKHGKNHNR